MASPRRRASSPSASWLHDRRRERRPGERHVLRRESARAGRVELRVRPDAAALRRRRRRSGERCSRGRGRRHEQPAAGRGRLRRATTRRPRRRRRTPRPASCSPRRPPRSRRGRRRRSTTSGISAPVEPAGVGRPASAPVGSRTIRCRTRCPNRSRSRCHYRPRLPTAALATPTTGPGVRVVARPTAPALSPPSPPPPDPTRRRAARLLRDGASQQRGERPCVLQTGHDRSASHARPRLGGRGSVPARGRAGPVRAPPTVGNEEHPVLAPSTLTLDADPRVRDVVYVHVTLAKSLRPAPAAGEPREVVDRGSRSCRARRRARRRDRRRQPRPRREREGDRATSEPVNPASPAPKPATTSCPFGSPDPEPVATAVHVAGVGVGDPDDGVGAEGAEREARPRRTGLGRVLPHERVRAEAVPAALAA